MLLIQNWAPYQIAARVAAQAMTNSLCSSFRWKTPLVALKLRNYLNTCYINALVQLLHPLLISIEGAGNIVFTATEQLLLEICAGFTDVKSLVNEIWASGKFSKHAQEDASELLSLYLSMEMPNVMRFCSYSRIYMYRCGFCGFRFKNKEYFNGESVSAERQKFMRAGHEAVENIYCQRCAAQKPFCKHVSPPLSKPPVRLVTINRFRGGSKLFDEVDLRSLMIDLDLEEYILFSYIVHLGDTMNNGHYICGRYHNNAFWILNDEAEPTIASDNETYGNAYILAFCLKTCILLDSEISLGSDVEREPSKILVDGETAECKNERNAPPNNNP